MTTKERFIEKYAYPFGKELGDNGDGLEFISDLNNLIAEELDQERDRINNKQLEIDNLMFSERTELLKEKDLEIERLRAFLGRISNLNHADTEDERGSWNAANHYQVMQKLAREALKEK